MAKPDCDDVASLRERSEIAHVGGSVYLSNYFAAKNRAKLTRFRITHVLCCARELPIPFEHELCCKRLELSDNPSQLLPVREAIEWIDEAVRGGGDKPNRVLLHCAAGGSRSASIALAWLMREHGLGYDDALARLRKVRYVEPNAGFEAQLRESTPIPAGPPTPTPTLDGLNVEAHS
jgi:hypothetical protein